MNRKNLIRSGANSGARSLKNHRIHAFPYGSCHAILLLYFQVAETDITVVERALTEKRKKEFYRGFHKRMRT
jgi:hypothetical protein